MPRQTRFILIGLACFISLLSLLLLSLPIESAAQESSAGNETARIATQDFIVSRAAATQMVVLTHAASTSSSIVNYAAETRAAYIGGVGGTREAASGQMQSTRQALSTRLFATQTYLGTRSAATRQSIDEKQAATIQALATNLQAQRRGLVATSTALYGQIEAAYGSVPAEIDTFLTRFAVGAGNVSYNPVDNSLVIINLLTESTVNVELDALTLAAGLAPEALDIDLQEGAIRLNFTDLETGTLISVSYTLTVNADGSISPTAFASSINGIRYAVDTLPDSFLENAERRIADATYFSIVGEIANSFRWETNRLTISEDELIMNFTLYLAP